MRVIHYMYKLLWKNDEEYIANKRPDLERSTSKAYQHFNIIENNASGNCLFHAVLEFLQKSKTKFKNIPKDAYELRLRTVKYVTASNSKGFQLNFDRFKDTLMFNLQHHIPNILNYGENEKDDIQIR